MSNASPWPARSRCSSCPAPPGWRGRRAHRRLGERLGGSQRVGVVLALAGVVLITARV